MRTDRRRFLTAAGAGLAALALPLPAFACGTGRRIDRVGVQLYTLRSELARDFEGTLAAVREIGYDEIEFAGYHDHTPEQIRAVLGRHGLRAPAAHVSLEALRDDAERTFDAAEMLGHRYLIVAWLAQEHRSSIDALKRTAATFNRIGEAAADRGLRFAYHNHDFEFTPVENRLPYDLLLAETSPQQVWFELDLFWIRKGGRDPLDYFAKHPGRFPLVHVKDMTAGGEMVDVGQGAIDWARIFARREQAGIEHFIVEHDEPADPLASVRRSHAYLSALRFE